MINRAKIWQDVKQAIWLSLGVACLVLIFIFWIMQSKERQTKELTPIEVKNEQEQIVTQQQSVLLDKKIGTFQEEVPPIDLLKRNALAGDHEPEFRGSAFIAENKNVWTLQLLKVAEEDVIRSYLDGREDRSQFHYFRLDDQKQNNVQYVLTYGVFKNTQAAIEEAQKVSFGLPKSVKVLPEKFNAYADMVNDLGSDENNSTTKLQSILLTRAAVPKVREVAPQATAESTVARQSLGGTTTTIQRTDESGEVQSSDTEHSQVKSGQNPTSAPTSNQNSNGAERQMPVEIIDPF